MIKMLEKMENYMYDAALVGAVLLNVIAKFCPAAAVAIGFVIAFYAGLGIMKGDV